MILHREALKAQLHQCSLLMHATGLEYLVGVFREVEYLVKLLHEFVRLTLTTRMQKQNFQSATCNAYLYFSIIPAHEDWYKT